jgi:hypothetical protein
MRLGRRQYQTPRGKFVSYISADTWHFDGIWLRDWIYSLPAYKLSQMDASRYVDFQSPLAGVGQAILACEHGR